MRDSSEPAKKRKKSDNFRLFAPQFKPNSYAEGLDRATRVARDKALEEAVSRTMKTWLMELEDTDALDLYKLKNTEALIKVGGAIRECNDGEPIRWAIDSNGAREHFGHNRLYNFMSGKNLPVDYFKIEVVYSMFGGLDARYVVVKTLPGPW